MDSILIKDTTREEREQIVAESIGNISGSCDGCAAGIVEMYQDYIDGKKEIRDINQEFSERANKTGSGVSLSEYTYEDYLKDFELDHLGFEEDIHDPCLRFQR